MLFWGASKLVVRQPISTEAVRLPAVTAWTLLAGIKIRRP
jgi:hypothetical protein